ncbi:hypothetical protein, partial [Aeromonas veronii]
QCLHRENRLPAPGRVVVNILPVNGYIATAWLMVIRGRRSADSSNTKRVPEREMPISADPMP